MKKNISYSMTDMAMEDRPRERLVAYGAQNLHTRELLMILLGSGHKGADVMELADAILAMRPGITGFSDIDFHELTSINGVKTSKATTILAAIELGRRVHGKTYNTAVSVRDPDAVADLFMDQMRNQKKEEFWILLVDVKCRTYAREQVSVGILNQSLIHPREVFKKAVQQSARGIILVHNHPSGDPQPSKEDLAITERLVEAGRIMGIDVMDHLIIGRDDYYSFRQYGRM